jgi:hypothetical protein
MSLQSPLEFKADHQNPRAAGELVLVAEKKKIRKERKFLKNSAARASRLLRTLLYIPWLRL